MSTAERLGFMFFWVLIVGIIFVKAGRTTKQTGGQQTAEIIHASFTGLNGLLATSTSQ